MAHTSACTEFLCSEEAALLLKANLAPGCELQECIPPQPQDRFEFVVCQVALPPCRVYVRRPRDAGPQQAGRVQCYALSARANPCRTMGSVMRRTGGLRGSRVCKCTRLRTSGISGSEMCTLKSRMECNCVILKSSSSRGMVSAGLSFRCVYSLVICSVWAFSACGVQGS